MDSDSESVYEGNRLNAIDMRSDRLYRLNVIDGEWQ